MKLKNGTDLEELQKSLQKKKDPKIRCISVCSGTGCHASGCHEVIKSIEEELSRLGLQKEVEVRKTGCHGFCEKGPIMVIHPEGIFYQRVKTDNIPQIIEKTILHNRIIEEFLYVDPETNQKITYEKEVPFYKKQQRLILGNNGEIDPTKIDDYIAIGGYSAFSKALTQMKPEQIIDEVKRAGLRGRGGAGFPTGVKWEITRKSKGELKYVVCNADEGDPGAYMDRSLLEGNPHSVLEGMLIGAYAIGAEKGFVYVRNEYPLAVDNITLATEQAREYGLLGSKILGKEFKFDVDIVRGAGAFVCGEETALMASIEGKKGVPRQRPPFPSESGIFGKPTNINNVETWANIPLIINRGGNEYAKIGTEKSKGTKIFSVVGKINNTGLVEVPMGTTLSQIVYKIGGGVLNKKKLKAVQIGGPSGGYLPRDMIDVPIDYDALTQLGSMMGSGGMVIMDEDTCMVDMTKYYLTFLLEESCGKCLTCREGIERMLEVVTRITEGKGAEEDIDILNDLADVVKDASMCGLGQTAPNPVLSTLRYFKDEYVTHIKEKKCPAGICRSLIKFEILAEKCTGCTACKLKCPQTAISGEKKKLHVIDQAKCVKCGICFETCRFDAITKR